ncbi:lymphocyte antigen 75-like [Nerophis lumbriciformis]|uniref:lymphocyte antigen 75-like n=1 Tax=Nerophis lumbriciformis TaxID=546530 RepID=UPI002ADFEFCF|nr:macrophage mannose receptor 1-like [Nerophis lumbriciformis]
MKWSAPVLVLLAGVGALSSFVGRPRQYHYAKDAVNWQEAQSLCRNFHRDLATVNNAKQAKRLVAVSHRSIGGLGGKAWIGLRSDLTEWIWSNPFDSYLSPNLYSNWKRGQPDNFNGNQLCVGMDVNGLWDDYSCAELLSFVCYNDEAGEDEAERFVLMERRLNWTEAQNHCRIFYTDLPTIDSETDNEQIRNIAGGEEVWIGLSRTRFWSDGSYSPFRLWAKGQPDNANGVQQCTAVDLSTKDGLWTDENCDIDLPYVCLTDNVHMVNLQVKLNSALRLTEEALAVLVETDFFTTLLRMGLPENIKVRLNRVIKPEPNLLIIDA